MLKVIFEQWCMFKVVVEVGGFNQVVEQVYKSQFSIYYVVQKFEYVLDFILFFNEGCCVILIEVGELMYCWVCFLLEEVYKVESVVSSFILGIEIYL